MTFSRRQMLMLYGRIPNHRFIFKDFDFHEVDDLTIVHRESGYYFRVYISHEKVSAKGAESLLGAVYTPLQTGLVIKAKKEYKKEALESWDAIIEVFDEWLNFLQAEFGLATPPTPTDDERIKLRWSGKSGQNRVLTFARHERQPSTY